MKNVSNPLSRLAIAVGTAAMIGLAPAAFADETVALKHALYGAGYAISNVSPQMDDATRAALKKFQMDNGLSVTGLVDDGTKKALGLISVQVAAAASTPAASAPAKKADSSAPAKAEKPADNAAAEEGEEEGWSLW